jgi:hypothetical protein
MGAVDAYVLLQLLEGIVGTWCKCVKAGWMQVTRVCVGEYCRLLQIMVRREPVEWIREHRDDFGPFSDGR